jgi:hypothetical protein
MALIGGLTFSVNFIVRLAQRNSQAFSSGKGKVEPVNGLVQRAFDLVCDFGSASVPDERR